MCYYLAGFGTNLHSWGWSCLWGRWSELCALIHSWQWLPSAQGHPALCYGCSFSTMHQDGATRPLPPHMCRGPFNPPQTRG